MQLQDNITAIGVATCRDSPSQKLLRTCLVPHAGTVPHKSFCAPV
jgi:hypothetical protein